MTIGVTKLTGNPPRFLRQKHPDLPALSITILFIDLENRPFVTIGDDQADVPALRFVVQRPDRSVLKLGLVRQNRGQKPRSALIVGQIGERMELLVVGKGPN